MDDREILESVMVCFRLLLKAQGFIVDQHIAGVTSYDEFHRLYEILENSKKHLMFIKLKYTEEQR